MSAGSNSRARQSLDADSRRWLERLDPTHPAHQQAVADLRKLLLRVAAHELSRRRGQLGAVAGPEFDDLTEQSANDALVTILGKLDDFEGRSRFTTWAIKFAIFEVSTKVARHAWQRQPPSRDEFSFEQLPDAWTPRPDDDFERREQLRILSASIRELTERQREVFVAIALNDVSIDMIALRLGTNRNEIYKNLFDARRKLRACLSAAGHPVTREDEVQA
jgi:RNA polymerase sigma-70 factor (ECF subfamily)